MRVNLKLPRRTPCCEFLDSFSTRKVEVAMKRTVSSLVLVVLVSLSLTWPAGFKSKAQASKANATRGQTTLPGDRVWPRGYSLPSEAQILIFQPQVASWEGQKHLVALAAVSYVAKGEKKPAMGTIKLEADTSVALAERLVKFSTIKITETNFQTLSKEQVQEIVTEIDKAIPDDDRTIGLDRVLVQMDKSQITPKNVEGLKS